LKKSRRGTYTTTPLRGKKKKRMAFWAPSRRHRAARRMNEETGPFSRKAKYAVDGRNARIAPFRWNRTVLDLTLYGAERSPAVQRVRPLRRTQPPMET